MHRKEWRIHTFRGVVCIRAVEESIQLAIRTPMTTPSHFKFGIIHKVIIHGMT